MLKLLELMKMTGYSIVQNHGQRKFGPPPDWCGPPPPKGCEVFVVKLPHDVFEDILVPTFARVGKIYQMRLMMSFSGLNRGFAFVKYTTKFEAYRAVKELNGFQIRPGIKIAVVKSFDNCRLFIGNIPNTITREQILEQLSKLVPGIVDVTLYKNCLDKRLNRGFAYVEFMSHRAAAMARRVLLPGPVNIWNQDLLVDWAVPEPDVEYEQMKWHLEKKEYANSRKDDEAIGSAYANDSVCGSPNNFKSLQYPNPIAPMRKSYPLVSAELDSMCQRYGWAQPVYEYQKHLDHTGAEMWIGRVELPQIGLPLLTTTRRVGPFITKACFSLQQAHVEAAEIALYYIKTLNTSLMQVSTPAPVQLYPSVVQPVPSTSNCVGYDYTSIPSDTTSASHSANNCTGNFWTGLDIFGKYCD